MGVQHCLSVDVEGFVEGMAESFPVSEMYFNQEAETREIEANVEATLFLFDQLQIVGTFFILGRIAKILPNVTKKIASHGHEIASHSLFHKRIYNQSRSEFEQDLIRSKHFLEDITGQRVCGFRAPDFSITENSLWALDVIREAGFVYDSSLTPTNIHDVYGLPGRPVCVHRLGNGLWEFPPSTFSILGKTIPFGGGGYMRLYPTWLTRILLHQKDRRYHSCMLYMHPYELGPVIPLIDGLSAYRKFRHYYNVKSGGRKLQRVVKNFNFTKALSIISEQD